MKMTVFEGTPEEIAKVARALRQEGAHPMPSASFLESAMSETNGSPDVPAAPEQAEEFPTVEFARRVLTRRDLRRRQKIVFEVLKDAHPGWVSRDELCAATDYTAHQLAGLMGAFGRRTARTEGYEQGASLFETKWDVELEAYRYRLSDSAFEALAIEDVI